MADHTFYAIKFYNLNILLFCFVWGDILRCGGLASQQTNDPPGSQQQPTGQQDVCGLCNSNNGFQQPTATESAANNESETDCEEI